MVEVWENLKKMKFSRRSINTAVFPYKNGNFSCAEPSTRAVLLHTGTRVDSLSWVVFARSDGFSTRAVLLHTGTRVDAPVASKILIFRISFGTRLCSDFPISVDSTTEQVAPNSTKIDVLAKFDV